MLFRSTSSSRQVSLKIAVLALALAGCGSSSSNPSDGGTGHGDRRSGGDAGSVSQSVLSVSGPANNLALQPCGVAAASQSLAAGSYTISLDSSTLSKGTVVTTDGSQVKSLDPYVLVYLPIPEGDKDSSHRFFMLNGAGSSYSFSLAAAGGLQAMFVDSDQDANTGTASLTIQPGGLQVTVDAAANVLRWKQGCNSTPATKDFNAGSYLYKLTGSSLSSGSGSKDDYVIIRTPSEDPSDAQRYVVLNGVGDTKSVSFNNSGTLRAWALGLQSPPSGSAQVEIDSH